MQKSFKFGVKPCTAPLPLTLHRPLALHSPLTPLCLLTLHRPLTLDVKQQRSKGSGVLKVVVGEDIPGSHETQEEVDKHPGKCDHL